MHGAHHHPALVGGDDKPGAQGRSARSGVVGLTQLLPAVGQQLIDPPGRTGADAIEHTAEVSLRVDPQVLARRAQAHQDRRRLTSLVAPRE
jgi:hypothetical protein